MSREGADRFGARVSRAALTRRGWRAMHGDGFNLTFLAGCPARAAGRANGSPRRPSSRAGVPAAPYRDPFPLARRCAGVRRDRIPGGRSASTEPRHRSHRAAGVTVDLPVVDRARRSSS
jgi:hypothetical protein